MWKTIGVSPLQGWYMLAAAAFAALALFELVTRADDRRKIRAGLAEDPRGKDTLLVRHNPVPYPKWRIWSEGLLVILAGVCLAAVFSSMLEYRRYGAFYDASWRSPDVEAHFEFEASAGEKLEAEWLADPEGFDFAAVPVVLVKFGCPDCEAVAGAIHGLEDSGYVVVYSRSGLGKAYVDRYGIDWLPTAMYNGLAVQLRAGSRPAAPVTGSEEPGQDAGSGSAMSDGEKAQGILDGLLSGDGFAELTEDDLKYGTVAAIQGASEQDASGGDGEEP